MANQLDTAMVALPCDAGYETLRQDLARAVTRVCPPWLADQVDDLTHVAMMRVMKLAPRGDRDRALSRGYLTKVAYTTVVDEIRRRRRRREVSLEDNCGASEARGHGFGAPPIDPEQIASGREIGAQIGDCLARLSDSRRLAVTLHLQGHTLRQSAALLGWTAKRTENLIYRGLADLRKCLAAKGISP